MSPTRVVVSLSLVALASCFSKPADVDWDANPNPPDAARIDAPDATSIDSMPGVPDAAIDGPPGTFHIGGTVSGMWDGAAISMHLQATGVDEFKTVSANTGFNFDDALPTGTDYTVTVGTAPNAHSCGVQSGIGTIANADVNNIAVTCTGPTVTISLSAPIDWTFNDATLAYALDTSIAIQETGFTVTAPDATAIALNTSTSLTSGVASAPVALAFGANSETVRVDVGTITRTYTIGLDRGAVPIAQYVYGKASNTDAGDQFGESVAMSNDTLVVGAWQEDSLDGTQSNNAGTDAGAVYVFRRNGTVWTQEAYLKASSIDAGDNFGESVAISGDTIAVGAPTEDSAATGIGGSATDDSAADAGAVYVFHRVGTSWTLQAYVKASNTDADDRFGTGVALDGDSLAVIAVREDSVATGINGDQTSDTASNSGAAYVFTRSGSTWSQQAYIKASNSRAGMLFGQNMSLSGNTLAVGVTSESSCSTGVNGSQTSTSCSNAGATYVFVRNGSTWSQQAYVKASNTQTADQFGSSIAVLGDVLAVGAHNEDSGSTTSQGDNSQSSAGAVYVFGRNGTTWQQRAYVKEPQPLMGHQVGTSVFLAGDLLAIGAAAETPGGAVHVFRNANGTWTFAQTLGASNAESADQSATASLSLEGIGVTGAFEDSLATGINPTDTGNGPAGASTDSGAAYLFK